MMSRKSNHLMMRKLRENIKNNVVHNKREKN